MLSARRFDVLIVGMGPAGIAAACAASAAGDARVGVVDDNAREGGQIWRGDAARSGPAAGWLARFRASRIEILTETRVFDSPEAGVLYAETSHGSMELRYGKLILAAGARERFLPFPGWTLPNVMGAGGLQALAKGGAPVAGKRIVIAGSGPLLLAVAAYLRRHGAVIPVIAEQAGWAQLRRFGAAIAREPAKVAQGLGLKWALRGVPYVGACWPVEAIGDEHVVEVELQTEKRKWRERCDYLACAFGLVPNLELPLLLGCAIRNGFVMVNEWQESSQAGVYCAGEPIGIGGVDAALVEGQIAGFAAAGLTDEARRPFRARERALRFRAVLEQCFALRDELRTLARPETIVCRCEDVSLEQMRAHTGWRPAKLQTRCGMGPCQGRICGPAAEFLFGWRQDSVRPPIFPVKLEHLSL